jgi:ComF family protein
MSVFELAIGWLAPPQCISCTAEGSALCSDCCATQVIPYGQRCYQCGRHSQQSKTCVSCYRRGSPRFAWITTNYEATAKELVKLYKFGQQRGVAKPLAEMMSATVLSQTDPKELPNYLVVPVPTATSRVRQRGFDHAATLARSVAINLGLEHSRALGRLGQARQIGSKRADRIAQTAGNYYVRRPNLIIGRSILLVDDVVTTGATLQAATSALKAAGAANVDALVFAKRL